MMFHGLGMDMTQAANSSTIGTANVNQGSADCQWCRANPFLSVITPSCWALNDKICDFASIPQAFVAGGVPVAPPSQAIIDAQTPDETINQILTQSQQNAVDAATRAAAQDVQLQSDTSILPGVCVKGSLTYNAFLCWLNDYSGVLMIGVVGVVGLSLMNKRR